MRAFFAVFFTKEMAANGAGVDSPLAFSYNEGKTMESFFSSLEKRVADTSSLLCVGLDPHLTDLPVPSAEGALLICLDLVQSTSPFTAAFNPNAAFFEQFGAPGWEALRQVIEAVGEQSRRQGSLIPVILDAKRGDIASTAEAYARSAFQALGAHAITLSPYLGRDSVEPFLADPERGAFLLCKTSNPGARDLQDLKVGESGDPLFIAVARLARLWNTRNNVGLVVGATHPEALALVRQTAPELWLLAPGVGAQGGELEAALRAGLRADGKGLLLPVSRALSRAADPGKAAAELRDAIVSILYDSNKDR